MHVMSNFQNPRWRQAARCLGAVWSRFSELRANCLYLVNLVVDMVEERRDRNGRGRSLTGAFAALCIMEGSYDTIASSTLKRDVPSQTLLEWMTPHCSTSKDYDVIHQLFVRILHIT